MHYIFGNIVYFIAFCLVSSRQAAAMTSSLRFCSRNHEWTVCRSLPQQQRCCMASTHWERTPCETEYEGKKNAKRENSLFITIILIAFVIVVIRGSLPVLSTQQMDRMLTLRSFVRSLSVFANKSLQNVLPTYTHATHTTYNTEYRAGRKSIYIMRIIYYAYNFLHHTGTLKQ